MSLTRHWATLRSNGSRSRAKRRRTRRTRRRPKKKALPRNLPLPLKANPHLLVPSLLKIQILLLLLPKTLKEATKSTHQRTRLKLNLRHQAVEISTQMRQEAQLCHYHKTLRATLHPHRTPSLPLALKTSNPLPIPLSLPLRSLSLILAHLLPLERRLLQLDLELFTPRLISTLA